jgi:hypothetical protein
LSFLRTGRRQHHPPGRATDRADDFALGESAPKEAAAGAARPLGIQVHAVNFPEVHQQAQIASRPAVQGDQQTAAIRFGPAMNNHGSLPDIVASLCPGGDSMQASGPRPSFSHYCPPASRQIANGERYLQ